MPDAEIFILDGGVQPARQRHAGLAHLRQQVGAVHPGREARRGHGVRGDGVAERHLPHAQRGDAGLDRAADARVPGKARLQAFLQNLAQADVERKHQVDRRRAKVGRLAGFVGFHDGQPVAPIGVITARRRLARLERSQRARPGHQQRQARRHAHRLLRSGEGHVHAPLAHAQVLAGHRANAVGDHQRAVALPERGQPGQVGQHARGGVHVGDGHHLVAARLERRFHLIQPGVPARRCFDVRHLRAVAFEDDANAVAKVTGIDHQGAVAGLHQVGAGGIHAQRARTRQHEGLPVRALEDLAGALQRLPEGLDEVGRQVAGGRRAHGG